MVNYTARYTKISSGYMGQILEWPEVVTEGGNIEDCREILQDALKEMILAYRSLEKPIPQEPVLVETLPISDAIRCSDN